MKIIITYQDFDKDHDRDTEFGIEVFTIKEAKHEIETWLLSTLDSYYSKFKSVEFKSEMNDEDDESDEDISRQLQKHADDFLKRIKLKKEIATSKKEIADCKKWIENIEPTKTKVLMTIQKETEKIQKLQAELAAI